MPQEILDSVVVHELCHRKHMNHSKDFYEEIYQHLQRELVKAGFIGQFIDTACNKAPKMKSQLRKEISGILNSGIRGLITDGFSFYSLPRHEEILQGAP